MVKYARVTLFSLNFPGPAKNLRKAARAMFLGRKIKWLDKEAMNLELQWNWRAGTFRVRMANWPAEDVLMTHWPNEAYLESSIRCAVQALLSDWLYLQHSSASDWRRDLKATKKFDRFPHPWYRKGLHHVRLSSQGRAFAWNCLLRLHAANAERVRARNLEALLTLTRTLHVQDIIEDIIETVPTFDLTV